MGNFYVNSYEKVVFINVENVIYVFIYNSLELDKIIEIILLEGCLILVILG